MLVVIITMTFYVIYDICYYWVLTTTLWEWVCCFPHFIDVSWRWSSFRYPKLNIWRVTEQGFWPQITWLKILCFNTLLILKLGWWEIVKIEGVKKRGEQFEMHYNNVFVQIHVTKSGMLSSLKENGGYLRCQNTSPWILLFWTLAIL